ncbi:MAG TPA: zinc finger domain-containing protein, partial [Alphaproteobacteria bacterium]|nr:zinc finger domain-containing protein [Alphaproteobacteria bacterium]
LSITSKVDVAETHVMPEEALTLDEVPELGVRVELAHGEKCARCWKVLEEVGKVAAYPDLCHRCADVVERIDGNL